MNSSSPPPALPPTIMVWDLLVRCCHWSLAAAFAYAWATRTGDYEPHLIAGYIVAGLVLVRILWGFTGPTHARFRDFVRGPAETWRYLRAMMRGAPARFIGHNPAAGAMIVALLCTLLVITLSGVALDGAENRAGPLGELSLFLYRDRIAGLHEVASHAALVLIAVHLSGVLASSRLHKENLLLSMITGRKRSRSEGHDR